MAYQDKVRTFVKKEIEFQPAATKFKVFLVSLDAPQRQMADVEVHPGPLNDAVASVVEDVESVVKNAAEASSVIVRIRLVAHATYRNEAGKLKGRDKGWMEFIEGGQAQNTLPQKGMGPGETEPPTPAGVQTQQMRHNEALMRMSIDLMHSNVEYMRDNARMKDQQIAQLLGELKEQNEEEHEASQAKKHEREMEAAEREAKAQRMNQLMGSAIAHIGPTAGPEIGKLVSKFAAGVSGVIGGGSAPAAPPEADPTVTEIKKLVMDDPDTFGEMLSVMQKKDPAKAQKLLELLTAK